jgi:predicted ArsR family transcriptional regulator
MSSYAEGRKPHVRVEQDEILEVLRETGGGELPMIAKHFGVSEASARRKLDGLVARGVLRVAAGPPGPRFYWPAAPEGAV